MSVLCDKEISKYILDGMIDFSKSETDLDQVSRQINPNTLDLTLGRFIQWPKANEQPLVFGRPYAPEDFWELKEVNPDEGILLTPGDLFLGCSREYFRMPKDVCGQVYTKSSLGRVFINHMMAGVIDAGFEGTITLELRNEGKHNVVIPYGARVVQIQFSYLNEVPELDYSQRVSRYMGQIRPEPSRPEKK
ncbi:MAG: dCTP deaminase [Anaerolineaceae bacterium]|nr:dCTP deaminase [Anaerolineaceae bacterium]